MLNWLFGTRRFRTYEDSFARTRHGMLLGIRAAITNRLTKHQNVLLITHFAAPFEELQDHLAQWAIDYFIAPARLSSGQVVEAFSTSGRQVALSLSQQLVPEEIQSSVTATDSKTTCVVVIDRHPDGRTDLQVESFCRSIPGKVEFGYFMSFEDITIRHMVDKAAFRILDMFGMGENELVTSNMISRRLKAALSRNAKSIVTDFPADSAEEWLRINAPAIEPGTMPNMPNNENRRTSDRASE